MPKCAVRTGGYLDSIHHDRGTWSAYPGYADRVSTHNASLRGIGYLQFERRTIKWSAGEISNYLACLPVERCFNRQRIVSRLRGTGYFDIECATAPDHHRPAPHKHLCLGRIDRTRDLYRVSHLKFTSFRWFGKIKGQFRRCGINR